jgi:hypothetical protein
MSPLSPVGKSPSTSPNPGLNPALQAVLGSLDVNLEAELARFRRDRPRKASPSNASPPPASPKPLETISVKATNGNGATGIPNGTSANSPFETIAPPTSPVSPVQPPVSEPSNSTQAPSISPTEIQPDDYLESSEALLKNLTAEPSSKEDQSESESRSDGLLSPLGIGSMLLLLLASATFGYVWVNPASVSHLNRIFGREKPKTAQTAANKPGETSAKTAKNLPNSPNLASQEFEQLTLRSLGRVEPRVTPPIVPLASPRPQTPVNTPAPLPAAQPANVPLDLSRTLLPQPFQSGAASGNAPQAVPTPTTTPTPARNNNRPGGRQPAASRTAPKGGNRFLVVMAYNGDRSLAQARRVASAAYVRRLRDGNRIQLASFPTAAEARAKVQALKKQGISAQLYRR